MARKNSSPENSRKRVRLNARDARTWDRAIRQAERRELVRELRTAGM